MRKVKMKGVFISSKRKGKVSVIKDKIFVSPNPLGHAQVPGTRLHTSKGAEGAG